MADYANPGSLVSTQWVADNMKDPKVRLIEVDVDTAAYETGHIPGAVAWDWKKDLETDVMRNIADKEGIETTPVPGRRGQELDHRPLR